MLARTNSSVVIIGALSLISTIAKLGSSCQEGLLEPPRASNKKQQIDVHGFDAKPTSLPQNADAGRSLQDEQKRKAGTNQIPTGSRTKPGKESPMQLKKMHEKANIVRKNLVKARSELDCDSKKSWSSKTTPNFDLQLATLKRSRSPTSKSSISTADGSDELSFISKVREQDNTTLEVESVEVEECEVPPPKRSRLDVIGGLLPPSPSRKKVYCISSVSPCSQTSGHLARKNATAYQGFYATIVSPWF